MKAERRHELEANELARWLTQATDRSRGHFTTIVWGGAAVLAVIVAISVWGALRGGSERQAWADYYSASGAEPHQIVKQLKTVIDGHPNTQVALWARLDLADQLSYEGKRDLDTDPEIGRLRLKEAQQNYAAVLESSNAVPEMVRRAALPEAMIWELLGDREQAIGRYKQLASKYATSHPAMAADAASRASELETPAAADFYKWFAERKPMSPGSNLAPPTIPGLDMNFPPDAADSPAAPGVTPETNSDTTETDANKPVEPGETKTEPGDEAKKPAEESKTDAAADPPKANDSSTEAPKPEQPKNSNNDNSSSEKPEPAKDSSEPPAESGQS